MSAKWFSLCTIFLVFASLPQVTALMISDPENVTRMVVEVTQSGHLILNSLSVTSTAEELRLSLYVPQNDSRQRASITKVIGPDNYSMIEDEYGNSQIFMEWGNPPLDRKIDYLVETLVEARKKSSEESRDFPVTSLVAPDKGIIEAAYVIGAGKKSVETMLRLGDWVNSHVTYDIGCEHVTLPAQWVYAEGRGTCDEYSNLLLSMLKLLGYKSWYVAGFAYLGGKQEGGTSFGAHAWIEAELGGVTYDIDPTWAESPVDATHIIMARLPDSNFTEHTEARSRNVRIEWNKQDTTYSLIDYDEYPRIDIKMDIVPDSVQGRKNVLVLADLLADGCVLSRLNLASCVKKGGGSLIAIEETKKSVVFCDSKTMYWTAATPDVDSGMVYTCHLSAATGGARKTEKLVINQNRGEGIVMDVSTQKILVPGQTMLVQVVANNPGFGSQNLRIFAILDDEIQETPLNLGGKDSADLEFELTAPAIPGEYDLIVFSSSGDKETEKISVISERQIKITEIEISNKIELDETGTINVTVKNFGEDTEASIKVQIASFQDTENVEIKKDETKIVGLNYHAASEGKQSVIISLLDSEGAYQDSWAGTIEVTRELSLKEGISKQLEDFFMWLWEAISSLFGF